MIDLNFSRLCQGKILGNLIIKKRVSQDIKSCFVINKFITTEKSGETDFEVIDILRQRDK